MAAMFTCRMRAYAAAHFHWDDVLGVEWGDGRGYFQSEYTGGEDGRAYPVTIHMEIRGEGTSLDEAEPRLSQALSNVLPILALAGNAAIADPLLITTHGIDLSTPQPFRGYRTPRGDEWWPPGKRRLDKSACTELVRVVMSNRPFAEVLQRAMEAYRRALSHWMPEQRLMAGEFLFIAAETLGRFLVERRAASLGITPKNLVRLERAGTPAGLRRSYLRNEVFPGDPAAFEALETASNGFEHGYMSIDEARSLFEPVLERAMGLVRMGLISASDAGDGVKSRLLASDYSEPRGLVPEIMFVAGQLRRIDQDQPPPPLDGVTVELKWSNAAPITNRDANGEVIFTVKPRVSPTNLPSNTVLDLDGFGMRAPYMTPSGGPMEVEVTRARPGDDTNT